jgi:tRNA (guanine10-N2)-dimethyltransferase
LKPRSLVFLSGEGTTIPLAEAKALFLTYDPASTFNTPDPRLVVADSAADPLVIGTRIAFARRVGRLVEDVDQAKDLLRGHRVRFRCFDVLGQGTQPDPEDYLRGVDAEIDLSHPELELTLVRGEREYIAVTSPETMGQGWSTRRPRRRPFFHPSAIFPKLSRALVNLSRCREEEVFLEPFAGTGSIALEAHLVGAEVLAVDLSDKMVRGSLANMKHFGQGWLGALRADAAHLPFRSADAVATDMPYGRASSTRGRSPERILHDTIPELAAVMKAGSRLVLMHSQALAVQGAGEFAVEEEHHLHVHKLLTRTISVLRRR